MLTLVKDCWNALLKHFGAVDINECQNENACRQGLCVNTIGSYYCQCKSGFKYLDNGSCVDLDECVEIRNACKQAETCFNLIGSYNCPCSTGFTNNFGQSRFCEDLDECLNANVCRNSDCVNTYGSYDCECYPGFTMLSSGSCEDINECERDILCGERGTCHNLIGSYWCQCSDGFSIYGNKENYCIELSCDQYEKQTGQTLPGFDSLLTQMRDNCLMLTNSSSSRPTEKRLTGDVLLKVLVNATDEVQLGFQNMRLRVASDVTSFLHTIEISIRLIAPQLTENVTRMVTNYTEAEILVNRDRTQPKGPVRLTNEKAQLDTTWETVAGDEQNYPGFAFVILLSYKNWNTLNASSSDPSQQLMSDVVTVSISNPNSENLSQPVNLTFSHLQSRDADLKCVYWSEEDGLGVWSGQGCTTVMLNSTHTICSCNHLSSFAVMEGIKGKGLSTVMWVCLLVALACVVLSLITTMWCRSVSRKRHQRQSQQSAQIHTR
ncbi:hypothetical protein UPYG_G00216710 [Umbra pygmaea]|uniref:Uncharacterized protein n=1 Tax=Umbra pygmaea TaxID=75934 RepID=A0ABD0X2Z9_UMBPY